MRCELRVYHLGAHSWSWSFVGSTRAEVLLLSSDEVLRSLRGVFRSLLIRQKLFHEIHICTRRLRSFMCFMHSGLWSGLLWCNLLLSSCLTHHAHQCLIICIIRFMPSFLRCCNRRWRCTRFPSWCRSSYVSWWTWFPSSCSVFLLNLFYLIFTSRPCWNLIISHYLSSINIASRLWWRSSKWVVDDKCRFVNIQVFRRSIRIFQNFPWRLILLNDCARIHSRIRRRDLLPTLRSLFQRFVAFSDLFIKSFFVGAQFLVFIEQSALQLIVSLSIRLLPRRRARPAGSRLQRLPGRGHFGDVVVEGFVAGLVACTGSFLWSYLRTLKLRLGLRNTRISLVRRHRLTCNNFRIRNFASEVFFRRETRRRISSHLIVHWIVSVYFANSAFLAVRFEEFG